MVKNIPLLTALVTKKDKKSKNNHVNRKSLESSVVFHVGVRLSHHLRKEEKKRSGNKKEMVPETTIQRGE